jgi:putative endonuclease
VKYNVTILVYFESYDDVHRAIGREKEIKGWRREKKVALIESVNPRWNDLSYGWYQRHRFAPDRKVW